MNEKDLLFGGMAESEIAQLAPHEAIYPKGGTIFREGERATAFGMVLDGTVQISNTDVDGNRSIVLTAGKGFLFGEALALMGARTYPVTATALEDCTVVLIASDRLQKCESRTFLLNMMRLMARSNLLFRRKLNTMGRRTTREKLMQYLSDEAKACGRMTFDIPLDRQELADYLGVERSAMSAEIGRMVRDGLIETRRSRFTLLKSAVD